MNIAFDRFRHPQKQGFQGGNLSDDHWSPDEAARWALRRAREERARKVRVRGFWWIAAAIVFTAFILAATALLAQDNPEAVRWFRLAADQGFARPGGSPNQPALLSIAGAS